MLQFNTTYFWRIDGKNKGGVGLQGDTWQFTTEKAPLLAVTVPSVDVGMREVGEAYTQSFTVRNDGGGVLSGSVNTNAGWVQFTAPTYFSLSAGQSQIITISGNVPLTPGLLNANIHISSNGGIKDLPVTGLAEVYVRWTKANSPYLISENTVSEFGYRLFIDPGVAIKFDTGKSLQVNGTLVARGTSALPVTFTSAQASPKAGDWGRIYFGSTSTAAVFDGSGNYLNGSIIEHSIIEYGSGPSGMVVLDQASPLISRSVIRHGSGNGVHTSHHGNGVVVRSCEIYGNSGWGIMDSGTGDGTLTATGNIVRNNGLGGITQSGGVASNNIIAANGRGVSFSTFAGTATFSHNSIVNNTVSTLGNSANPTSIVSIQPMASYGTIFQSNTLSGNRGSGTSFAALVVGYGSRTSNPVISGNNLFDTASYLLYNMNANNSPALAATNNWWGTAVEGEIQTKIYDWSDDGSKGIVSYAPFLSTPDTAAPISLPAELNASLSGSEITLSWKSNPESDVAGYKIYWATEAGYPYTNSVDVGNVTTFTITGIDPTKIYHVAVTAYDQDYNPASDDPDTAINENQTNGNESWYTEAVATATPPTDTEAPINGSNNFINGGIPTVLTTNVTLTLSGTDNTGIAGYWVSESAVAPAANDAGWITITETKAYHANVPFILSSENGAKTVNFWLKDAVGNISQETSDTITLNTSLVGTPVHGIITANSTWTKANSPYVVLDNVLVSEGQSLTIDSGVTIKFDTGKSLQINGTLIARGTSALPITFTSVQTSPAVGDWGRIYFGSTSKAAVFDGSGNYLNGSIIEHSVIEYGSGPVGMVFLDQASPFISRSVIRHGSGNGIYNSLQGNGVVVRSCEIYSNGGWGIMDFGMGNGTFTATGNIVRNNGLGGITLSGGVANNNIITANGTGVSVSSLIGTATFSHNSIVNNSVSTLGNSAFPTSIVSIQPMSDNGMIFQSNTLSGNRGSGTSFAALVVGYGSRTSNPVISGNNLFDTASYLLYNMNANNSPALAATNNWWGTAVEGEIQTKIYDWSDDGSKGIVSYAPFLSTPDTAAPISLPAELNASLSGSEITLSWKSNPESDVAGYKIYWATEAGYPYTNSVDVGNVTTFTITGIDPTKIYHVAVTAYDQDYNPASDDPDTAINENQTNGNESWFTELTVIQNFMVSFNSNGGSAVSSQSIVYNTVVTSPSAPTKTGYTFAGWYSDSGLTSVFAFTTTITVDTALYAKWTINSYSVSFNSNGGSAVSSQSIVYKTAAALPTAPTKTGYTFAGWYSDAAFTSAFAFTTAITADTTLYAKWTINNFIVSFNSYGGSVVSSQSSIYNTVATSPLAPTKTGYTFAGWYSDAAFTSAFAFTTAITTDTALYAKWTINSYTVSFNSNSGSAVSSQSVVYNTVATSLSAPTKTGYTFAGWYSDAAFTSAFAFTTAITTDTALYAKWTINSYTVSFNSNGGSAVSSQSIVYNTVATSPLAPTKTGYTFAGWYSDAAFTSAFAFTTAITTDTALYAKWTINSYTVSFNSNGGSAVSSQSIVYNTVVTSLSAPTKTGYTFAGWYSDSGLISVFAFTTAITADTTLYAKWTINSYTVSFNSNSGSAVRSQSVVYNTVATSPPTPTKTGYTFAGWYSDAAFTSAFAFTSAITTDTTLYAKWTALPTYKVIYNGNDNTSGTIPTDSSTYLQGATITVLSNTGALTRTGYTFAGWNTVSNGGGVNYAEAATLIIGAGDITLYAIFVDVSGPIMDISALADKAITNNATMNITGKVSDSDSDVKNLTVNGLSATVATDGTFTVAITLAAGTNTITTIATDNANNQTTDIRTITLDTTAPTLTVSAPADNSKTAQSLATITGTIDETSTVTVKLNSGSPQNASITENGYSADVTLVSGLNTITVTATDLAGNTTTVVRSVTYDNTKPSLSVSNPAQDISTTQTSITISGTVTDIVTSATISITADGQTFTPTVATDGSFSQSINLPTDKTYAVVVTATDQAGNSTTSQRNIIKTATAATGDITGDGKVDIADALKALRIAIGLDAATPALLLLADVAPLAGGKPAPDGVIDIADALVILEKAVGLFTW